MKRVGIQWIVENVEKSIAFYSTKLGFEIDWVGEGPKFAILSRGNFYVMLRQLKEKGHARPNRISFIKAGWHTEGQEAWDAYIWVKDADKLYKEFIANDVSIIKPIQNTQYGNRDFEIEDIDGYILCFGHSNE
ncbi:VOC family protein [uncultured Winogradskyella sp.]|uniref:VOC family protein n=1 Tax=uncultured Winogradskyella sp. TaxID=395353 RepID=UPI002622EF4B|nr:VOC family protein [uncultured Winogradskyella sp.]